MRTVFLCIATLALLMPASAGASTLTFDNGTLTYTASPGVANSVSVNPAGASVSISVTDNDLFATRPGNCTLVLALPPDSAYGCAGVTRVVINAGDLDDSITAADTLADALMRLSRPSEALQGAGVSVETRDTDASLVPSVLANPPDALTRP